MFLFIFFFFFFFFFNDTATTEIYTLSLHDALPIRAAARAALDDPAAQMPTMSKAGTSPGRSSDRKSTRLNSSHANISYAVFCLKKKKQITRKHDRNSRSTHITIN